jgi:Siphovirus Gp157
LNNLTLYKLYNITHEHRKLVDGLDDSPLSEDLLSQISSSESARNELLGVLVTTDLEESMLIDALETQIKTLEARKKRLKTRHTNIRKSLFAILNMGQLKRVETPTCTIALNKGALKLVVKNETYLMAGNPEYFQQKYILNKRLLMEDLKAGVYCEDAELIREPTLTIRRA